MLARTVAVGAFAGRLSSRRPYCIQSAVDRPRSTPATRVVRNPPVRTAAWAAVRGMATQRVPGARPQGRPTSTRRRSARWPSRVPGTRRRLAGLLESMRRPTRGKATDTPR